MLAKKGKLECRDLGPSTVRRHSFMRPRTQHGIADRAALPRVDTPPWMTLPSDDCLQDWDRWEEQTK
jgi:hypothetical protein